MYVHINVKYYTPQHAPLTLISHSKMSGGHEINRGGGRFLTSLLRLKSLEGHAEERYEQRKYGMRHSNSDCFENVSPLLGNTTKLRPNKIKNAPISSTQLF